ncbi:MFS transporter [Microtetraspora sp. NBRC 13810]|uniref:DHA2 family efflux MFS transporter permease subunit n=1 Tax=Microtetraspora sp. NBRC 13810 TaxID=3030990 RepID=UPI0024A60802|nr:DHA2 family efflux MFS transporter permease subunit [Microtetraspora sp. NBRC 13810]GLW13162.1 MFS transporter [Microtetraspora sp. NBRC 13810]
MTPRPPDRIDGTLLRLIGVLGLGGVISYFDATIVNVSIHTLKAQFSVPLSSISWVATGYLLALAVAVPLAGWSVARFGARRMWLVGLASFLVGSSLAALSWDAGSLIAFRVLQGLGAGLIEPIMLTMLATAAGPSRTARVMGLMTIPMTLGPVLGPIIGGLILQNLSWQWIFLVNVPVGLLAIVLALVAIPPDTPSAGQAPPLDALGVALLCPAFAAVVYALSQAGTAGFGVPQVIVALVAGSVLLAGYVVHALRAEHPLIDLKLFGGKDFSSSVVTMFLLGGMLFALLFLLPLFYQQVRGHGAFVAGLLVMPLGLGLFGTPIAGKIADRFGPRLLVPMGATLIGLGALLYTGADAATSQVLLTAALLVVGFGMSLVGPPTMGSVYRTVPAESVGTATGAVFILNQIGASLGIAVVAMIVQHGLAAGTAPATALGTAFWWTVLGAAAVLVAGLFLPGRPQPPTSDAESTLKSVGEPA